MSVITILGLLLLILMMIFGGKKGLISFFTLFLNFIILIISILLIIFGTPIYLVTFFFCIVIAAINLFVLNIFRISFLRLPLLGIQILIIFIIKSESYLRYSDTFNIYENVQRSKPDRSLQISTHYLSSLIRKIVLPFVVV